MNIDAGADVDDQRNRNKQRDACLEASAKYLEKKQELPPHRPAARRFAAPNCVTVNGWPAMVIVPVRVLALAFAAIE